MIRLIIASLIWAFSFGLIKRYLTGLHPDFVAAARLGLSALLFLPWARLPRDSTGKFVLGSWLQLIAIGSIEFGVMYVCYLTSFQTLESWQIALFTSLTPVAVLGIATFYRRLGPRGEETLRGESGRAGKLIPVGLATLAAGVLVAQRFASTPSLTGFLLVQASNLCFAWGQVHHARTLRKFSPKTPAASLIFWEYCGGLLVAVLFLLARSSPLPSLESLWSLSGLVLLYSGCVASGLAFFLWNSGAPHVAPATLSVLNNLKAPLAASVSLWIFQERADTPTLVTALVLFGGGLTLARSLERTENTLLPATPLKK